MELARNAKRSKTVDYDPLRFLYLKLLILELSQSSAIQLQLQGVGSLAQQTEMFDVAPPNFMRFLTSLKRVDWVEIEEWIS